MRRRFKMHTNSSKRIGLSDHEVRLAGLLRDVISRRLSGEALTDDELIESHQELMPELGERLRELRRVEAARVRADQSSDVQSLVSAYISPPRELRRAEIEAGAIPGYEIVREIHRGGQGVVYLARQLSTSRQVALKVMREGPFASTGDRARFDREVRILAQLRHPNIVAIHDSGRAAGHDFFVMDYVDGRPLDAWAEAHTRRIADRIASRADSRAALRAVLNVFAKTCDAVAAAHRLGVIHRDLKPGNILVDGAGEPRVLDFGLAKVTDESHSPDGETRRATQAGQFVGSLPWSSPEQARGMQEHVDVRTDVYALGVVLYRMLTGRFPYDVSGNIRDSIDNILTATPRPPRSIGAAVDADVETIVLKCLEKQPERRYQGASEVSREIARYLAGESIEARRSSRWYVVRKALRRHWVVSSALLVVFTVIAASAVVLSFMYREQTRLRVEAETQSRKSARTTAFLQDMLASADPNQAMGRALTVREVLDAASEKLKSESAGDPEVASAIHRTLGQTYQSLGEFEKSERHQRAALELGRGAVGEDHRDTLTALNGWASALASLDRFDEAEAMFRQCLASRERVLGPHDPDTLDSAHNLADFLRNRGRWDDAEKLLTQTLSDSIRILGAEHPDTLITKKILAGLWQDRGKSEEAERALREVLETQKRVLGPRAPHTIGTMHYLALVLKSDGRLDEAEPLYREMIGVQNEVLGPDHPDSLKLMNSYGRLLAAKQEFEEAERVYRETIARQREKLGDEHIDTLITHNNLALLMQDQRRLDEAEPIARSVLETGQRVLGEDHPDVLIWMNNLGNLLFKKSDFEEAEPIYRRVLELRRRVLTENHSATHTSLYNAAQVLVELGRFDEAEPLARECLGDPNEEAGSPRFDTTLSRNLLARVLIGQSRAAEAEPLIRTALESAVATAGNPNIGFFRTTLGNCLTARGRYDEAEAELLKAMQEFESTGSLAQFRGRQCLKALAALYDAWNKPEQAAAFRARLAP